MPAAIPELECNERIHRGKTEPMAIKPHSKKGFPFTNYFVKGISGSQYLVEIRSLKRRINSCSCPDYQINTLETCKHIEAVLHSLKDMQIEENSPFVEIYLNGSSQVKIAWPKIPLKQVNFVHTLASYFSTEQTLLSDPVVALASIAHALSLSSQIARSKIRISARLLEWIALLREKEAGHLLRKQYLQDMALGKRKNSPLLKPFKERAVVKDESEALTLCNFLLQSHSACKALIVSSCLKKWEIISPFPLSEKNSERMAAYRASHCYFHIDYEKLPLHYHEINLFLSPDILILDTEERLQDWQNKTAWAVKQIKTPYLFILGSPASAYSSDDLFSIMQIVNPNVLGPLFKFQELLPESMQALLRPYWYF